MIAWECSCAILIGILLVLRLLFRNKLGATARYALWAVVLLRLLLPFSIGNARVSIPGALERISARMEDSHPDAPLNEVHEFESIDIYDAGVTEPKTEPITGQPNSELREGAASGTGTAVQAAAPVTVQWTKVVRIGWLAGAAAVALWFAFVNLRFARSLRRGRELSETDAALPVYTVPGLETPCLFGLFRPAVYLPPEAAEDDALRRYAVAHELTHRRHGDHIWAALRCLCIALHWWDPLVWAAAVVSRRDAELSCDESTLARLGASARMPYGEALIRMTVPNKAYLLRAATMMSGADLKERIRMIAQNRKTVRTALIAAAALLAVAAVFVFAGNSGGNRIFDSAAPDHSAMTLSYLDQEGGKTWFLFDNAKEKQILLELKKVRAVRTTERNAEEFDYPFYGLEIGTRDGNTIRVLWSDGYLIDWKGTVYRFDYPFDSLRGDDWRYRSEIGSVAELPNGAYLAQADGNWIKDRLSPAGEQTQPVPDGLRMTVTLLTEQAVTVGIENTGGETWTYGTPYSFDVLLDGAWYQVPMRPGDRNYGFDAIGLSLEPGKTVECACSFSPYAPLPAGVYRVVKSGLTAQFELRADKSGKPDQALPTAVPTMDATVEGPGAYTSVEGYLRSEVLRSCETEGVTMFRTDGAAVKLDFVETELAELTITGAVNDLAPEGQLQSWRYRLRLTFTEDAPELAMVSDMTLEDGRYVLNWTHDVVALAYPNDRVDVLYDAPVNDNMSFYGYHNSYEEAIYDWYVTAKGLDLPLYVMDWGAGLSASGNYPVHREDGDGWIIYIPVSGWKLTAATSVRRTWVSEYDTGSSITVREATAEEATAVHEYVEGVAVIFRTGSDGRYWRVTTKYDPKLLIYSSWVISEPEILRRMAESFQPYAVTVTGMYTSAPPPVEDLRTLQKSDPAQYTALMAGWAEEINMIGEQFVSVSGKAGEWQDLLNAFAERWCEKRLMASPDNPARCADAGILRLGDYLDAVSLTGAPRRLTFNVTLALGVPAANEEVFEYLSVGWAQKNEHGMYEIGTEAVLVSDNGIRWTVESLNSGGSGGWGWRNLKDDDAMTNVRYALENDEPIILLRFLPNMDWNELSDAETAAAMRMLKEAAVSDEPGYADGNDQLYRDLYMLWGFKRADGAYAELYLDGPDHCILARQYQADPQTFLTALAEMDAQTQQQVRQVLGI